MSSKIDKTFQQNFIELARTNDEGACFAEGSVLTGRCFPLCLVALTTVKVLCVRADDVSAMLVYEYNFFSAPLTSDASEKAKRPV